MDAAKLRLGGAAVLQRCRQNGVQLAAFMKPNWSLIGSAADERLAAHEAALEEELGRGRALVSAMVRAAPRTLSCAPATLQRRARALTAVRRARSPRPLPALLAGHALLPCRHVLRICAFAQRLVTAALRLPASFALACAGVFTRERLQKS